MLEAQMGQALQLKRVFEVMKDIINDANLECTENGLHIQAMDLSSVALVQLTLDSIGFAHYRCDRNRALGLNIKNVIKVFSLAGPTDSARIHCEDESESITFTFENEQERVSAFSMHLMALEQESLNVEESKYPAAQVLMGAKEFQNVVTNIKEFCDCVKISVDPYKIKFNAQGEIGGGGIMLKARENSGELGDIGVHIKVHRPVTQHFPTKYLHYFSRAASISDTVTLSMSPASPIELKFEIKGIPGGNITRNMGGMMDRSKSKKKSRNNAEEDGNEGSNVCNNNSADDMSVVIGNFTFYTAPKFMDDQEDQIQQQEATIYEEIKEQLMQGKAPTSSYTAGGGNVKSDIVKDEPIADPTQQTPQHEKSNTTDSTNEPMDEC